MSQSLRSRFRGAVNRLLNPVGLHLSRTDRTFEMDGVLSRAVRRGIAVATWIDVGASDGSWSLRAQRHFPEAHFLLFEPLQERQAVLAALHARHGFDHVAAVAGARSGTVRFSVDPNLDGSGVAEPGATVTRQVPVETIDDAIAARRWPGPYGIKLDTHGYELPVLEGASRTLAQVSFLIIEAYNFPLTPASLRFSELCAWLETRGFRCCDLADPMRRPTDGVLWQMDLAFARVDHPIFASNRYE